MVVIVAIALISRFVDLDALIAQSRTNVLAHGSDPRGVHEAVICSQNLANYGALPDVIRRVPGMSAERLAEKEAALVRRFAKAECDVIGVQEVLSRDEEAGKKALTRLATQLRFATYRQYDIATGPSNDPNLRNGYIFARDRVELLNKVSYYQVELPKLIETEKPRLFSRGPLEVQLQIKGQGEAPPKTLTLVNFHFKSKRGGKDDPAQLDWETARMQMAEAVRRIVNNRHKKSYEDGQSLLILLGDRNSHFDAASAKILDGTLSLGMFQGDGVCRLSKRGVPLCQAQQAKPPNFFSVLTSDPQTKLLTGTHRYKKEYSWLDEILMAQPGLAAAWERFDSTGDYASGVIYEPREASDHALVWVRLNW